MLISNIDIRNGSDFTANMNINQVLEALGLNRDGFEPNNNDWQNPWNFPWEFQERSWAYQGILLERPLGSQDIQGINEILFFPSDPDSVMDGSNEKFWECYLRNGEGNDGLSIVHNNRVLSYGQLPAEVLTRLVSYCLINDLRFELEVHE